MSRNCRDATAADEPYDAHACTGCAGCPCHHVPPPAPLRELIAAARRQEGTESAEGA
jgi:hypothetical protein